jgi:hypothetical protein
LKAGLALVVVVDATVVGAVVVAAAEVVDGVADVVGAVVEVTGAAVGELPEQAASNAAMATTPETRRDCTTRKLARLHGLIDERPAIHGSGRVGPHRLIPL